MIGRETVKRSSASEPSIDGEALLWDPSNVHSVEVTVDVEPELLGLARQLGVDVADAAQRGVEKTVREAMAAADRKAYLLLPEDEDPDWEAAETWDDGRPGLA